MAMLVLSVFLMAFSIFGLFLRAVSPGRQPAPAPPHNPPIPDGPKLSLTSSNTFTIAIFSDLHYGEEENGWGIDQDVNSTRVMASILDYQKPDLVVINGDLITGENTFKENSSYYVHQIVSPMVDRKVPWASTYGNHDSKYNLSREDIFAAEKKYPLSYTQHMDTKLPGITNYYLLIQQPGSGRPAAILWFFDSRGGASYQRDSSNKDDIPNWVAPETVDWFTKTAKDLQKTYGLLPSIAFVHIPPHPFLAAQRTGVDPARFPGINDDVPLSIQGEGSEDKPFANALLAEQGLHSVYVGHDHGDAWCSPWPEDHHLKPRAGQQKRHGDEHEGPFLCFSKHTGYGGYGNWNRGSRFVQLSFHDDNDDGDFNEEGEMEVQTWVRMENGDIVTHVTLNETYGTDIYPTEDGETPKAGKR